MDMEMDLDMDQGSHAAATTSSASNQQQQPQAKQESLPSISNLFQLVNQNDQSSSSASPSDSNLRGPFHRSESHLPPVVGSGAGLPLPPFSREKLPIPSSESPLRLPSSPAFLLQRSLSSSSPTANSPSPRDSLRSLDDVASSLPSAFGPMRGSGPTRNLYASSNSSSPSPGSHYSDLPLGAPSPSPSISSAASSIMSPRTTPKPQRLALGPSATTAFSIEDEMEYEKEVETERSSLEMSNPPHPAFKFPSRPASLSAARSFSSNGVDLSSNYIHRSSNPNSMLPPTTTNVGSRSAGLKPEASWTKHSRAGTEEGSQSHHSIATSSHSSSSSSSSHGKRRAEDEDQTFQDRLQKAPSTRRRHTLGAADAPDRSATSSRMSNLNPRSSLGADLAQAYSQFIPSAAPPVPTLPSLRDSPRFFGVATSHSSPAIPTVASHHHHHHHHPYQIPATSHARNPSAQSKQSSSGTDSYSSSRDSYHSYSSSRDSSYFGSNRNSNSHLSIRSGLPLPDSGRGGLPDSPTTPTGPNPNAGQETQFARHSQYSSSSSQEFVPRHSNRASNSTFASSTSSLPLTHSTRGSLPSLSSCASGSASASSLSLSVESRSSHSRNSTADSLHSNAWNRGAVGSHPPFLHHSVESELRDVNEREKTELHAFDSSYHPPQGLSSSGKPKGRKSKTKKKPSLPPRSSSLKLRQDAKDWESRDGSAGIDYETEGTYHDDSPETNSEKSILSGNGSGSGGSSNGGITPSQSQQVWSNESSWSSESVVRPNTNLPGRERNVSDGSGSGSSNGSFSRQSRISGMRSTQSSGPLASPGPGFFLPQRVSSMDLDEAYRRGPPDSSNQSHLRSSSQSSTTPALQNSSGMLSSSPSSSMSFRYNLPQADFKTNRRISGGSIASNFSGSSSGASSFHSLPLAHNQSTDSIGSFRVKDEGNELDPSPSFDDTGVDHQMSNVASDTSPSGKKNQSSGSASTSASTSTSGSGKYECEHCKKRFTRPSSLKIHIYTHTGERPFVCPDPSCGRSFSVQSNLRRHQKAHATWKERAADTIPEGVKVDTVTRSNSSRSKNFDSSFDRSYSSDSRHQARESSPPTSPPSNFGSSPIASEAFEHQQANEFDGRTAIQREGSLCPTRPSRATSTSSNLSIRERFEGMMGAD